MAVNIFDYLRKKTQSLDLIASSNSPRQGSGDAIWMSSRDGFSKQETNGKGVDLVLNSLSGELLHASWECVAEFGKFVEIGRRDFAGQGTLDMQRFEPNRTFAGFDMLLFSKSRPDIVEKTMEHAMSLYEAGSIQPIKPMTIHSATSAVDAFRVMQRAQHIRKIVLKMPYSCRELTLSPRRKELSLRDDGAYLLVGGLGGLGRSLSTWLCERGAQHIVYLSPSAGNITEDDPFICELAALGCTTTRVSGDVSNYDDVVQAIRSTKKPIRGVFQASMILRDCALVKMAWDNWQAAVSPKVQGTWNLHRALLETQPTSDLDFFFLFSSAGAISGQWGQANYNAGNTFLDAFVSYRHSLGLPASVLNIGVIEDVGYVNRNQDILDSLRSTSQYLMQEADLLQSIELILHRSSPAETVSDRSPLRYVVRSQIGIGLRSTLPITSPSNRTIWRKDPRMLVYRNLETGSADGGSSSLSSSEGALAHFLKEISSSMMLLKASETSTRLAEEINKTLSGFLMRDDVANLDAPLSVVGMDSLVSIELRNWIRRNIHVELTVLEIVQADSIRGLGIAAQAKLIRRYQARM